MHLAGIMRNQALILRHGGMTGKYFLKPLRKWAGFLPVFIVLAVIGHLVNEKQAQNLDTQRLQLLQLCKMRRHGALDLVAHHLVFQRVLPLAQAQHASAGKFDFIPANIVQFIAFTVRLAPV